MGITMLFNMTCFAAQENDIVAVMYHDISNESVKHNNYRVSPETLSEDIAEFKKQGYTFVKASEIDEIEDMEADKFVLLTFDDGYESFYTEIFPILQKHNVTATFYVITSRIGKSGHLTEKQIKELDSSGLVEIGPHSHFVHLNSAETIQKLYNGENTRPIAEADWLRSADILAKIIDKPITSLSYPNGIYSMELDKSLREKLGLKTTLSTDYGTVTNINRPLERMNRDLEYTSEEFVQKVEKEFCK